MRTRWMAAGLLCLLCSSVYASEWVYDVDVLKVGAYQQ